MSTKASPPLLKVKKEASSDDIKDFAETAMNELLGWYGYDKINQNEIAKPTKSSLADRKINHPESSKNESSCSNSITGLCDDTEHESSRDNSPTPPTLKTSLLIGTDCTWCRKTISSDSPEILGSPDGPIYCSESCFSQSRRASFKRAKTCDWCRHVRHAVSYVDFQDGASQLQFCSDKCLNQYKMQIFCNETQAHLDMNPHLKEKATTSSSSLITPDLWLKNCKSRSETPNSDRSRSLSPPKVPVVSKLPNVSTSISSESEVTKKPLITVAPVSKLLNKSFQPLTVRHPLRSVKRRKSHRTNNPIKTNNNNEMTVLNNNLHSIQDLRINNQPPTSEVPLLNRPQHTPAFITPPPNLPHLFPIRPSLRNQRFTTPPQPNNIPESPTFPRFSTALGAPPPVTVLVPYPIILPLPIPIPLIIPLPVCKNNVEAAKPTEKTNYKADTKEECNADNVSEATNSGNPEPLNLGKRKQINSELNDNCEQSSNNKDENAEQKLPKFKITRLASKRIMVNKESDKEKSRPLRKRKFDHQIIEVDGNPISKHTKN